MSVAKVAKMTRVALRILASLSCSVLLFGSVVAFVPAFAKHKHKHKHKHHPDSGHELFGCIIKHFNELDLNRDGILTGEEISANLQNPAITGTEAAALAAIKVQERFDMRKNKQFTSFTVADFKKLETGYGQGDKRSQGMVGFFEGAKHKITQQSPALFVGNRPHISGIRQGHTSACYFLSAVAALAEARPQAIMNMIAINEDGTYTVSFHDHVPLRILAPTQGEIAAYPDAGEDGVWLLVLEKAYGVIRENTKKPLNESVDAVTLHGGHAISVLSYLTGHKSKLYKFTDASTRSNITKILTDAFAAHKAVTASVPGHALAVVKFDPAKDQVQVWNPWGTTRDYARVHEEMKNGCFWMSVNDFGQRFSGIGVEQDH